MASPPVKSTTGLAIISQYKATGISESAAILKYAKPQEIKLELVCLVGKYILTASTHAKTPLNHVPVLTTRCFS
jgi:hypothetical protein